MPKGQFDSILPIKDCEHCQRKFIPARYWQKYCTARCRLAHYWTGEAQRIRTRSPDDLDILDLSLPPVGPSVAQEAEWQRRKDLAAEHTEKQEEEEALIRKSKAEKVIRQSGIDAPPVFDFDTWKDKK